MPIKSGLNRRKIVISNPPHLVWADLGPRPLKRANEANHRANTRDSFGKMAKVYRSKRAAVSIGKFVHDQVAGGLVEARRRHIDNLNSTDRCFGAFFTCCILNHQVLGSPVKRGP